MSDYEMPKIKHEHTPDIATPNAGGVMIKKPCFTNEKHHLDVLECLECRLSAHPYKWETCSHGKLHPFYPNWQRMTEQAAAGPWRYDIENAPLEKKLLLLFDKTSTRGSKYTNSGFVSKLRSNGFIDEDGCCFYNTPIAFAEINLPGGEK